MNQQLLNDISKYVETHIGEFHAARIAKLQNMNLKEILKRKNPYMLIAKRSLSAAEIVEMLVEEEMRLEEEKLFADWLRNIALYVLQLIGKNSLLMQNTSIHELCKSDFWKSCTNDEQLFCTLVEPAIVRCFAEDEVYQSAYARKLNGLTREFIEAYCNEEFSYDWNKLKHAMLWG